MFDIYGAWTECCDVRALLFYAAFRQHICDITMALITRRLTGLLRCNAYDWKAIQSMTVGTQI